ncbi:exported hypothetical protein [Nostocoides jenkinsii Ben 74]|uniref:Secreted protein n=1 Tax=Nostocoides jenkinsii Ben 74 TaxID=1193518 RepID=A0A077MAI6_9MICO|nr:exported hypothetical protein [Tetrasphaera jenkinsii Ben 74]
MLKPPPNSRLTSFARIGAVVLGCLLASSPAWSEGTFTSPIEHANNGFGSRTWTDLNTDGATNRARITACTSVASIGIYKDHQWPIPDEKVGGVSKTCDSWVSYSAGTRGDIHFTIKSGAGTTGTFYGTAKVEY